MDSDWSRLPYHLLYLILKKLVSSSDYLQFTAVCSSWYSISKNNQSMHINLSSQQVPMLIIPAEEEHIWRIYNVTNNTFLNLNLFVPHDTRLGGSSEGWLLTVNEDYGITLYGPTFMVEEGNIIQNNIIQLPPLFPPDPIEVIHIEKRGTYVKKIAIFTSDPIGNPYDLTTVVIYRNFELAYTKTAKDNTWTRVVDTQIPFDDVLYYNNQFYAITMNGKVISIDDTDLVNLNIKQITEEIPRYEEEEEEFLGSRSLVESLGELLMVERYWDVFDTGNCEHSGCEDRNREDSSDRFTVKFKVFKLSLDEPRWVEIKSLGEVALFLGDNSSLSVLASNFDGCLSNCIYFTHNEDTTGYGPHGPCDLGIYSVERSLLLWNYSINANVIAKMIKRPPIWLVPKINVY